VTSLGVLFVRRQPVRLSDAPKKNGRLRDAKTRHKKRPPDPASTYRAASTASTTTAPSLATAFVQFGFEASSAGFDESWPVTFFVVFFTALPVFFAPVSVPCAASFAPVFVASAVLSAAVLVASAVFVAPVFVASAVLVAAYLVA